MSTNPEAGWPTVRRYFDEQRGLWVTTWPENITGSFDDTMIRGPVAHRYQQAGNALGFNASPPPQQPPVPGPGRPAGGPPAHKPGQIPAGVRGGPVDSGDWLGGVIRWR